MSNVKSVTMKFPASGSTDVASYRLYMELAPLPVTYNSETFNINEDPIEGIISVDLSTLPGMTTKDGMYNFGVSSLDEAGNESSLSLINDVILDFVAPDPPGEITIIRV